MEVYLYNSLLYRFLKRVSELLSVFWNNSYLGLFTRKIYAVSSKSCLFRAFNSFVSRETCLSHSIFIRMIIALDKGAFNRLKALKFKILSHKILRLRILRLNILRLKAFGNKRCLVQDSLNSKSSVLAVFGAENLFCRDNIIYILATYLFVDLFIRKIIGIYFFSMYWDELFLIICIFISIFSWLTDRLPPNRSNGIILITPLHFPIFFYMSICLILFAFTTPDFSIGIEGLRVNIQYILWFFIVIGLFNSKQSVKKVFYLMVISGLLLGLHGIYQYIIGVEIPSSWVDMAEAGVRTRVFSIVGSPNILGSLMVIFIPLTISLIFFEKSIVLKLCLILTSIIMTTCLVFTFSRGAWIGFAVAVVVLAIIKEKRILILLLLGVLLVPVIVPSVADRITYMISPTYIESSLRGGRLMRWGEALEVLKQNLWFGVGLGRFGGAVATNHKDILANVFYTDNYYLKLAGEMGIVGLSAFLLLLYNVLTWCVRGVKLLGESKNKNLMYGGIAAICGIVVHNIFENIFEVPAMVIYFWIVVACIVYMGFVDRGFKSFSNGETARTCSEENFCIGKGEYKGEDRD